MPPHSLYDSIPQTTCIITSEDIFFATYWAFLIPYCIISLFFWYIDTQTSLVKLRTRSCDVDLLNKQYFSIVPLVAFNLFFIEPILIYFTTTTLITIDDKIGVFSLFETICHLLIFLSGFEVTFYISHRILHLRRIYPQVHYIHHQMQHTVAFGGVYAHPVEFILSNLIPSAVGTLLTTPSYYTLYSWSIFLAFYVTTVHCGYGGMHIEHHWFNKNNYSLFGIMDYLFDTILV
jgi:sterol desaturase/sphingolipid hydroxylase (fatty acid hydroxylase superfamily)